MNAACFEPLTGWIPAIDADKVKAAIIVSGVDGTIETKLYYQTATAVVQTTNSYAEVETTWTSGADERCTGDTALSIASAMWVRFAMAYKMPSGTVGQATVSVAVATRRS